MIRYKFLIFIVLVILYSPQARCHAGWGEHHADIIAVLGFEDSPQLRSWTKLISSDMIDKHEPFYSRFKQKHPGFRCKHRLFFHWGYNAEPWNPSLGAKVKEYCNRLQSQNKKRRISLNDTIKQFKEEIRGEQKRRNRLINEKTENTFGFGHGGKDAKNARFFASISYNVHLIGDYTSDNTDLEGLQNLKDIIGLIVIELRDFDKVRSREVIKGITNINKRYVGPQKKADVLLKYLKKEVPSFVKEAQNGSIYRRLGKKGVKFRK